MTSSALSLTASAPPVKRWTSLPDVAIINRQAYPLSRQLDADAGEMVLRKIEAMGVRVATKVSVTKMLTKTDEAGDEVFTGFELDSGETMQSDMVMCASFYTLCVSIADLERTASPLVFSRGTTWRGGAVSHVRRKAVLSSMTISRRRRTTSLRSASALRGAGIPMCVVALVCLLAVPPTDHAGPHCTRHRNGRCACAWSG